MSGRSASRSSPPRGATPRQRVYGPADVPADGAARRGARRVPVHARRARGRCTARACGRCGSTPASARPPRRTSATASCSSRGRPGLSVAFDLPTQMGHDPDAPIAQGEVGKVGRLDRVARGHGGPLRGHPARPRVDLDDDQRHRAHPARALRGGRRGGRAWPPSKLSGTIQNDILKEYIARGTYIFPPAPSMRLITDMFAFCRQHVPRWNTISISGYHMREAGSHGGAGGGLHAGQRRSPTCRRRVEAGLDVDDFAPAAVVLLQRAQRPPRGGRQVPGRPAAVGAAHARAVRRPRSPLADAALPRADGRQHADRAAAGEQHRAGDGAGAGRRAGRLPVAAHQLDGRGAGAAHRAGGAHRAPHAADPRPRVGRGRHRRPARRLLRGRAADRATSRRRPRSTSGRSTSWAARWRPSATCSARSRTPRTASSARSRTRRASWSASTSSSPTTPPPANLFQLDAGRRGGARRARWPACARTRDGDRAGAGAGRAGDAAPAAATT